ncbi:MAG: DUF2027 domain-containing protein [Bacteroidales bacterium]|nr:DUF2027 domain-containing protein [Bacteroidales bacterium]MBD5205307.1 DUF2027 domain-containing protein [Bacteroidales bacterium]MBD5222902.1 DUF2027 domain-containing protein [Bacteroidales bacterium]MBD5302747.1 DUF2027 domain-containing protein [Bacteroides sp.]MBD5347949.1 DUF2027 domain-containing protein [Bacteroides sp.]
MIKPGDTVRYLNAVGGGKVLRVDGRIAFVDDDGFETPVQTSELVVVLPAGHQDSTPGHKMFDQKAFDTGRSDKRSTPVNTAQSAKQTAPAEEDFPIEETEYGDDMTVVLAFEPENIKDLSNTVFNTVLVNDSNYFLDYQLLRRDAEKGWANVGRGVAAPNEIVDLAQYTQQSVNQLERVVFQAIAYKKDKSFEIKMPLSVSRKLDLSKFYKLHCFRPGIYFDTPVLEVPLFAEHPRKRK